MKKGQKMSEEQKRKIGNSNRNPSDETRKKISDAHKGESNPMFGKTGELHPNYGKPMSDEQKQKLSEAHKGKPSSFKGCKHTEEAKLANSEKHKGKIPWNKGLETGNLDQEHKQNISKSIFIWWSNLSDDIKRIRNRKISESKQGKLTYLRGFGQYYNCKNNEQIWLRSSFEVRVAHKLDKLNICWEYEPTSFDLGNHFYHPDFYLPEFDLWWEVKGWLRDQDKEKLINFSNMYPNKKIKIIFLEDIEELEKNFNNNIIKIGKNICDI